VSGDGEVEMPLLADHHHRKHKKDRRKTSEVVYGGSGSEQVGREELKYSHISVVVVVHTLAHGCPSAMMGE